MVIWENKLVKIEIWENKYWGKLEIVENGNYLKME